MKQRTLLDQKSLQITIRRLCFQLLENHSDFSETVMLGLQPRGILLAKRICSVLGKEFKIPNVVYGDLDVTFYRDDFRRHEKPLVPSSTQVDFIIEDKKVIIVDDVLYTGRTIRAGLDAMLAFGRPRSVELLVLVDRRYSRHLPIQPDYVGKRVDTLASEKVRVEWEETDKKDHVYLISNK